MPDLAVSLIRTWVPIGVGSALGWLALHGDVRVPPEHAMTLGTFAAGICAAWYYALARLLEHWSGTSVVARASRAVGRFMLGGVIRALAQQPVYVPPAPEPPTT